MNNFFRKFIEFSREHTPLWMHWKVGPLLARLDYFTRIYIFKNKNSPKILSINQTLDLVIKDKLSVIRFGDGEMSILTKVDLNFQKYSPELAERLKQIIQAKEPGLLICLPDLFGKLEGLEKFAYTFAMHHQFRFRQNWLDLISLNETYGNTFISRPYLAYNQEFRKHSGEVFKKIFSIWEGKKVLLIEGSGSRGGVGNDMFKNALSVSRILCPRENAFEKYQEILNAALPFDKNSIILMSLGPAAKVLGYDLFKAGFRVLDIGHLDMEYEMYVRKQPFQTKVKYKYFNEIHEREPEECLDPEYLSQIIVKV